MFDRAANTPLMSSFYKYHFLTFSFIWNFFPFVSFISSKVLYCLIQVNQASILAIHYFFRSKKNRQSQNRHGRMPEQVSEFKYGG